MRRRRFIGCCSLIRLGRFWLAVGLAAMLLLTIEISARAIVFLACAYRLRDHRELPECAAGYALERDAGKELTWKSFLYWRPVSYHGKYIQVDESGIRRTWRDPDLDESQSPPLRIFMFGGSTLWGDGARDDETIPSCLARCLADTFDERVIVTNLGVCGYVNQQELFLLMEQLRLGHRPDLVVFFDGVNDTLSALVNQRADAALFEARLTTPALQYMGVFRAFQLFGTSLGLRRPDIPSDNDALASALVSHYEANIQLVDRLGQAYGFDSLFFWQPTLFSKRQLTPRERGNLLDEGFLNLSGTLLTLDEDTPTQFFHAVYDRAKHIEHSNWHDLSDLFDDYPLDAFIDYCHTSENANRVIAQRMAITIGEVLKRRRSDSGKTTLRHSQDPHARLIARIPAE